MAVAPPSFFSFLRWDCAILAQTAGIVSARFSGKSERIEAIVERLFLPTRDVIRDFGGLAFQG